MRRRILFKLTPLLDLLLIVIFAYQIRSTQLVAETTRLAEEGREQASRVARNETEFRERVESDARALRKQNEVMMEELSKLRQRLETTRERVKALSVILHEVTSDIPAEDFARILSAADPETLVKIEETVDRLRGEGPGAVLRELTRFQAVRKHVTLWAIHLPGDQRVELRVDDREPREFTVAGAAPVARNELGRALRELEQPKDLVIIFFSWSRVLKEWKDVMGDTLHHLTTETLRTTYPGKRFHVSREGYKETGEGK